MRRLASDVSSHSPTHLSQRPCEIENGPCTRTESPQPVLAQPWKSARNLGASPQEAQNEGHTPVLPLYHLSDCIRKLERKTGWLASQDMLSEHADPMMMQMQTSCLTTRSQPRQHTQRCKSIKRIPLHRRMTVCYAQSSQYPLPAARRG